MLTRGWFRLSLKLIPNIKILRIIYFIMEFPYLQSQKPTHFKTNDCFVISQSLRKGSNLNRLSKIPRPI